eukprot:gene10241-biopygen8337
MCKTNCMRFGQTSPNAHCIAFLMNCAMASKTNVVPSMRPSPSFSLWLNKRGNHQSPVLRFLGRQLQLSLFRSLDTKDAYSYGGSADQFHCSTLRPARHASGVRSPV